jgi:cytosine/adenosine deaminase-related metal-dependent hydrolase
VTVRVVSGRWLLDGIRSAIPEGAVALQGEVVLAIGPREVIEAQYGPAERLDAILLPALVNAHLHLELSHLGLVPGGDGLPGWIGRFVRLRAATPEAAAAPAMEAAADQLVRFGVAAVGDVTNTLGSLGPLARRGLAGTLYHELFGATPDRIEAALARARAAADAAGPAPAGLRIVTSPHAPYSTHHPTLARLLAVGPASIHLAEDPAERELLARGEGPFSAILASLGATPADLTRARSAVALVAPSLHAGNLAVHCVDLDAEDVALLARSGAAVVLCPRSNLHIGGRLPDLPALLGGGMRLAIGTDSLASCPSLSPLAELALLRRAFPSVPSQRLLSLAWNGAAVGAPWIGRLAPRTSPGVIAAPLDGARVDDPFEFLAGPFGEEGRAVSWIARAARS